MEPGFWGWYGGRGSWLQPRRVAKLCEECAISEQSEGIEGKGEKPRAEGYSGTIVVDRGFGGIRWSLQGREKEGSGSMWWLALVMLDTRGLLQENGKKRRWMEQRFGSDKKWRRLRGFEGVWGGHRVRMRCWYRQKDESTSLCSAYSEF